MEKDYFALTELDLDEFSDRSRADIRLTSGGIRETSCCIICNKKIECQKNKENSCQEYVLDKENPNKIKRIIVETLCDTF